VRLRRGGRSTLGVDIGSARIKAAVIDHSAAAPRLVRLVSEPIMPGTIVDGELVNADAATTALRHIVDIIGTTPPAVVTAVGGRDVIVRTVTMDRMSAVDAKEVISWDADRYLPFDLNEVHLQIQLLDPRGDGAEMDILLVAARKTLVHERSTLLAAAGLDPTVIEVDAFALSNAFEFAYPEFSDAHVVLVNIGRETTTVVVRDAGAPVATRDIAFGTRYLEDDLSPLLGGSIPDVEAMLTGEVSPVPVVDGVLRAQADELSMAVERAASTPVDGSSQAARFGAAWLSGGGARIPGVQEAIARRLRTQTEIANPLKCLTMNPEVAAAIPDHGASMWMIAVGMALRTAR
jgi:type IV pilus assembly protein PilM